MQATLGFALNREIRFPQTKTLDSDGQVGRKLVYHFASAGSNPTRVKLLNFKKIFTFEIYNKVSANEKVGQGWSSG